VVVLTITIIICSSHEAQVKAVHFPKNGSLHKKMVVWQKNNKMYDFYFKRFSIWRIFNKMHGKVISDSAEQQITQLENICFTEGYCMLETVTYVKDFHTLISDC
jgi:hypothetical protein